MSKKTPTKADKTSDSASTSSSQNPSSDSLRETIESVVVAFILAFLFRTFEAEAFVIPTGSMAPTMYGRHKDVECAQCSTHFTVGASDEVDRDSNYLEANPELHRVTAAECPNCHFVTPIKNAAVFKGDRILVNKFPYEFGDPHRWDVVVFKYPEEPKTNYIKRLVALPGEILSIEWGDLYVRRSLTEEKKVLRKEDPNKQRQLQLLVYDNDRPETLLHEYGWPERWAAIDPQTGRETEDGWSADTERRSFSIDQVAAGDQDVRWIRYRHVVPTPQDWSHAIAEEAVDQPQPRLITDFCYYNAYHGGNDEGSRLDDDIYWVGDLTVDCELTVHQAQGSVMLELVRGDRRYRCRIDLSTGEVAFFYLDEYPEASVTELATRQTSISGPGTYRVAFANVDQRLCLWIDDSLVDFGTAGEYSPPAHPGPREGDLAPVGIAADGAAVDVAHLVIRRDIYYRSVKEGAGEEYATPGKAGLARLLGDPEAWYDEFNEHRQSVEFAQLGPDEYFMLGDNSPRSQDSRLWPNQFNRRERRHAVSRSALVGKAFFVYWPHGVPFLNGGEGFAPDVQPLDRLFYHAVKQRNGDVQLTDYPRYRIPFYPQVSRMRRIR